MFIVIYVLYITTYNCNDSKCLGKRVTSCIGRMTLLFYVFEQKIPARDDDSAMPKTYRWNFIFLWVSYRYFDEYEIDIVFKNDIVYISYGVVSQNRVENYSQHGSVDLCCDV